MNNTDEKIRILNMVQDGKITAKELQNCWKP